VASEAPVSFGPKLAAGTGLNAYHEREKGELFLFAASAAQFVVGPRAKSRTSAIFRLSLCDQLEPPLRWCLAFWAFGKGLNDPGKHILSLLIRSTVTLANPERLCLDHGLFYVLSGGRSSDRPL